MRTETDSRAGDARRVWPLTAIQLLLVAAYAYAAVAYLTTDADFFPEQSPPGWSWPAVVVVGIGFVPALLCLAVALPGWLPRACGPNGPPRSGSPWPAPSPC